MTDMNAHRILVPDYEVKIAGTRLPENIVDALLEIVVDSTIDGPSMFSLRFVDNQDLELIESTTFDLGKAVEIKLAASLNDPEKFTFKGEITAIEPIFGEASMAQLVIRGYDKSHRLYRGTVTKTYIEKKDSELAATIAREVGLTTDIDTTTVVHKHIYQHAVNNMEFLQQRANRIGYEFWVDNEKLYFKKPSSSLGSAGTLEMGVHLIEFMPSLSVAHQVNEVEVRGWDPQQKHEIVGTASSSTVHPSIGYGKSGGQAGQSAIAAAKRLEVRYPVASQAEANLMAQAILDNINSEFIVAHGTTFGNPKIKIGHKVTISNVGSRFNGDYKVTACRHTFDAENGYRTEFTVRGMTADSMATFAFDQAETTLDRWPGVVTAIVTDLQNPDQDHAVVKVKFPWLDNAQDSYWARVAMVGAGKDRGFFVMPEVNDEVLVAFEHGDFNRPYIPGGLYNGVDTPVEPNGAFANGNVEVRTFKTRTGHMFRFVEKNGESSIEIVDGAGNTRIFLDSTNKVIQVTSQDTMKLESIGDLSIETQGNMSLKATGDIKIEATGNLEMKGQMVKTNSMSNTEFSATANMTVKSNGMMSVQGNGPTEVKSPAILTIQGSLVKIN